MIPHSRPLLTERDEAAVLECLRSGMVAEGRRVRELEDYFAERYEAAGAVSTGSGTQALVLALRAVGIREQVEVVLPTYVCAEVLAAVEYVGGTPVLVDVLDDYLIDPSDVERVLTPRTGAIIVPYVMGIWRDPSRLLALEIPVIEDCAQLIDRAGEGAIWHLRGDAAVFSFEGTKVVSGGEGGLVLARDESVLEELRAFKRYQNTGYKLNMFPLSEIQAALVLSQMTQAEEFLDARLRLADRYFEELGGHTGFVLPEHVRAASMFFRYPIRLLEEVVGDVDVALTRLERAGIAARRPVDCLLHRLRQEPGRFESAERLFASTISLPIYPALGWEEQTAVIEATMAVLAT